MGKSPTDKISKFAKTSKPKPLRTSSFAKNATGAAGVHLVVAQLSIMGYVALPTTRNLKSVDIVAFNETLDKFAFIQVKTTARTSGGWPVHTIKKDDDWQSDLNKAISIGERFFYVFVLLPRMETDHPVYYVLPSSEVASMIVKDMEKFQGQRPGRTLARNLCAWGYFGIPEEVVAKHKGEWDLLGLGPPPII